MAKGWQGVEQAAQQAAEGRERAQNAGKPQLRTSDVKVSYGKGPVIVRFLEQGEDVNNYPTHDYQVPGPRGVAYRRFTCLGEIGMECPGCKAGLKVKVRGAYNVIQRNRPQIQRGPDNRPMTGPGGQYDYIYSGAKDEVVILVVPSTTAEELRKKDAKFRGLASRDLELSESGNTFQPWGIDIADPDAPAQPMSETDIMLAQQKFDLDEFMKPPSQAEAADIVRKYGQNSGAQGGGGGYSGPQGNANAGQPANGFLEGASPDAVAAATGGAFGAAQG